MIILQFDFYFFLYHNAVTNLIDNFEVNEKPGLSRLRS